MGFHMRKALWSTAFGRLRADLWRTQLKPGGLRQLRAVDGDGQRRLCKKVLRRASWTTWSRLSRPFSPQRLATKRLIGILVISSGHVWLSPAPESDTDKLSAKKSWQLQSDYDSKQPENARESPRSVVNPCKSRYVYSSPPCPLGRCGFLADPPYGTAPPASRGTSPATFLYQKRRHEGHGRCRSSFGTGAFISGLKGGVSDVSSFSLGPQHVTEGTRRYGRAALRLLATQ